MSESECQIRRSKFAAAVEADSTMALKSSESKELAVNIMAKYDRDGNGQFDLAEVVDILEDLQDEQKDKLKAQKQVRLLGIIFVVIVSCLGLFVGLNAVITWMTVDSAKDTETLKALLTDRNGNVVAAKTAETTLPLIAAPVLDVATLASTDRLVITYALSGTATVEASVQVSDVFKYSDTWVDFKLNQCGQVCGKVVIKDGAAVYTDTDGIDYTVCASNASCSAFTVNEEAEVEALVAAAQLALGDSTSNGGRRRLDLPGIPCLPKPYTFSDSDELREAVTSFLASDPKALAKYGDISTWNTRLVTDMSSLFEGKSDFNEDISEWDTRSVTDMSVRAIIHSRYCVVIVA